MSLFANIEASIKAEVEKGAAAVVAAWHSSIEPFLKALLTDIKQHETAALKPFADQLVGQAAGLFVTAIQTGNWGNFFQHQAEAALGTLNAARAAGIQAAETSASAAVLAAVASHPGVQAAYSAQSQLAAPKPAG